MRVERYRDRGLQEVEKGSKRGGKGRKGSQAELLPKSDVGNKLPKTALKTPKKKKVKYALLKS